VKEKKTTDKDAGALEMHVYPHVGHVRLADFTLGHAQEVLRHVPRERSSAVRRQVAQLLGRVLKLAVYPCELVKSSPLPPGFLPRVKVRPGAYLYPSEDRALLACAGSGGKPGVPLANRLLYGFLAREGMRKEEALAMTWSDLDLEPGAVRLDENKTDDPRAWALDPGVLKALAWWKKTHHKDDTPTALVFGDVDDPDHLPDALRAHLKLAGVDRAELFEHTAKRRRINVHGLRSTFVTVSLANGKSETWVSDRTGHRSSTMVNRYRRVARTAAELGLGVSPPVPVGTNFSGITGSQFPENRSAVPRLDRAVARLGRRRTGQGRSRVAGGEADP
jgi:integrase